MIYEILCNGKVHYTRPEGHPDIAEALALIEWHKKICGVSSYEVRPTPRAVDGGQAAVKIGQVALPTATNANRSADTSKKEGNMKFVLEHFPGTFTYAVVSLIIIVYTIVAAEQSVQLTALLVGVLGVLSGVGFGIIWAASVLRRN